MGKFKVTYEKGSILYSKIIECRFNGMVGLQEYLKNIEESYADSIKSIEQLEPIQKLD